jgi:hypothetical protein
MRIVFLIAALLALAGCASHRDVTFIYYPNAPRSSPFPPPSQFYAVAEQECGRYGMKAVHSWDTYTEFDRVRVIYNCVQ